MSKFSLFDFFSFFLPGASFLLIIYCYLHLGWGIDYKTALTSNLFLPLYLVISYTAGHVINDFSYQVVRSLPLSKGTFEKALSFEHVSASAENDRIFRERLNRTSNEKFHIVFLDDASNLNPERLELAYDRMYDYNEVRDKDAKTKVLRSQISFFQNMIPIWGIATVILLAGLAFKLSLNAFAAASYGLMSIAIVSMLLLFVYSIFAFRKRKKLCAHHTYRIFLSIVEGEFVNKSVEPVEQVGVN